MTAVWAGLWRALALVALFVALTLTPAVEAVKHGPGVLAAEADHRAFHAENGDPHEHAGDGHHDAADHDHTVAIILAEPGLTDYPLPHRVLTPEATSAASAIREGPRRPPRSDVT
jgi:ABC-type Zn2+ transport system substrate-binding protein/surface adhesin